VTRNEILSHRTKDPDSTRAKLVETAFLEIYENGYAGASLDQILAKTGVTKGALYHHFGSKAALLHAVIDEIIRSYVVQGWTKPLESSDDPIQTLVETGMGFMQNELKKDLVRGCPLNNLAQELSNSDEDLRVHLRQVFDEWCSGIARGLERGQELGKVRKDIDPVATATFIVSSLEGIAGTAKSTRDYELTTSAAKVLFQFISSLSTDDARSREAA
jgi:AcrR family transcriptional regulator